MLNKPGRLTDAEFDVIRKHPKDGYDILRKSSEIGQIPLDITLHHHERMDGRGYPDKLPGDGISPLAPKVNVFFSTRSDTYIKPQEVDLSKPLGMGGGDRILSHEAPEKWRVDPMRFLSLE